MVLWLLLVVVMVVGVVLVAAGRGGELSEDARLDPPSGLPPDRPVSAADVGRLRFPLALRGYRMLDVDRALALLRERLAELEGEVADLRAPKPRPAEVERTPEK